jgi:hypothetical protein
MVNRVQTLRSSTPGVRPTGRSAGELYTNYPDNQLGVVNAAGAAFDLLAVRFFSSLATYVVGDYVKQGTLVYRCITANGPGAFNGANWSQLQTAADAAVYAPLASPVFTGDPKAPTPTAGDNDTSIATTAFVTGGIATAVAPLAPLASPVFTGNPQAPTPTVGDNDTSIATTAFVATATGNSGVVVSDTAPATPPNGKLWFDSVSGSLYVSYDDGSSQQWVVANNVPADLSGYAPLAYVDSRLANTSYRNLLRRNGGFEVWQRGAGGVAVIATPAGPAATYGPDGWYLYTSAGQLSTMTQSGPVAVTGSKFSCGISRNAGQTGVANMIFGFPLDTDELAAMLGKFVRLSFRIVAGANFSPASGNITAYLAVGTGAPTKQANGFTGQTFPLQQTISVPAGGGAQAVEINSSVIVPTTTNQAEVLFLWTPVGTAGAADGFYIDDVQLEIVPAATGYVSSNFERLNFEEQLLLCQRHFYKSFHYSIAPAAGTGLISGEQWVLQAVGASAFQDGNFHFMPVELRVTGTVFTYNPVTPGSIQARNAVNNTDCTGVATNGTKRGVRWYYSTAPGSGAGHSNVLHFVLDAGI